MKNKNSNNESINENDLKKSELFYKYTILGYNELKDLDKEIEEKAWKFFTALTLIIGLFLYLLNIFAEHKINDYTILDWFQMIASIVVLISIIVNWFMIFKVVKLKIYKNLPMKQDVIDYFKSYDLNTIYENSAKQNVDIYSDNLKNFLSKSEHLENAIKLFTANTLGLILILLIIIIKYFIYG